MSKNSKSALLIANGQAPSKKLIDSYRQRVDLVVAADGGANTAYKLNIIPDLVVGDFDSLNPDLRKVFKKTEFLQVKGQDNSDLEKALDLLKQRQVKEVIISAISGGRIDFTLANFINLWQYAKDIELKIIAEDWQAYPLKQKNIFSAAIGSRLSLIPFGKVKGVSLQGLKYPLKNKDLRANQAAVSNTVVESPFSVTLQQGQLLLVLYDLSRINLVEFHLFNLLFIV